MYTEPELKSFLDIKYKLSRCDCLHFGYAVRILTFYSVVFFFKLKESREFSALTAAPLGPGNPMTPGCPLAPMGPGGPGRPSCPALPY